MIGAAWIVTHVKQKRGGVFQPERYNITVAKFSTLYLFIGTLLGNLDQHYYTNHPDLMFIGLNGKNNNM